MTERAIENNQEMKTALNQTTFLNELRRDRNNSYISTTKNGSAHQVLTSKENKEVALRMIAIQDESLKLDKEIMPVVFTIKSNQ
jgi:hypothetical protein